MDTKILIENANIICDAFAESIVQFGEYQLKDKGAVGVFAQFDNAVELHKSYTLEHALFSLEYISKEKFGHLLVADIVSNCDDMPDEWFEPLVETLRCGGIDVY